MEDETRHCIRCEVEKPKSDFRNGNKQCKACQYEINKNRINSNAETFFKTMAREAKSRSNTRLKKGRIEAGRYEIDWEFIRDLYAKQNGKCYYSKVQMALQLESDWQCSIERLDQTLGYVPENVVLCAVEFQSYAQWSPDKYKEFMELLHINHVANISPDIFEKPTKKKTWKLVEKIMAIDGTITHARCNQMCKLLKPIDQFNKAPFHGCKQCETILSKTRKESPRGGMSQLLCDMRRNSKLRGHEQPELTQQDLYDKFIAQQGMCALTGIPLTFGTNKPWMASPERQDTKQHYTKENTCFIIFELNTPRQWTKEKVAYIKEVWAANQDT